MKNKILNTDVDKSHGLLAAGRNVAPGGKSPGLLSTMAQQFPEIPKSAWKLFWLTSRKSGNMHGKNFDGRSEKTHNMHAKNFVCSAKKR